LPNFLGLRKNFPIPAIACFSPLASAALAAVFWSVRLKQSVWVLNGFFSPADFCELRSVALDLLFHRDADGYFTAVALRDQLLFRC